MFDTPKPNGSFECMAHSVTAAAQIAGIGKTSLYEAIKCGDLKARKFGSRTLILRSDLEQFLNNLPAVAA